MTEVKSKGTFTQTKRGKAMFNNNKDKITDGRLSVCGRCNKGIFRNRHTWKWTKIGLLHTECITDEDTIAA